MSKSTSIRECDLVPRRPRNFTTFCYLISSVAWLLFNTAKICITKVVGIGLSPANNENNWLENFMGDSCKKTYLGPGTEILGFQTGFTALTRSFLITTGENLSKTQKNHLLLHRCNSQQRCLSLSSVHLCSVGNLPLNFGFNLLI